jgi:hypothetical protein
VFSVDSVSQLSGHRNDAYRTLGGTMRTKRKTRQRRLDGRIEKIVARLIDEGLGAPQIVQELQRLKGYVEVVGPKLRQATTNEELLELAEGLAPLGLDLLDVLALLEAKIPDERTIRRRIAERKPPDPHDPWTLAATEGDKAARLLPVLRAVLERTEGRTKGFSKATAEWIVRVRRAAPDLDPWTAYRTALAYQRRTGPDTEDLDTFLAFAPWRSPEATKHLWDWALAHRPNWFQMARLLGPQEADKAINAGLLALAVPSLAAVEKIQIAVPAAEGMVIAMEITTDARYAALSDAEKARIDDMWAQLQGIIKVEEVQDEQAQR